MEGTNLLRARARIFTEVSRSVDKLKSKSDRRVPNLTKLVVQKVVNINVVFAKKF